MRKFFAFFVTLLIAGIVAVAAESAEVGDKVVISSAKANLRSDSSTNAKVVTQMNGGDVVTILEIRVQPDRTWYRVRTAKGREGWVSERIVRELEPTGQEIGTNLVITSAKANLRSAPSAKAKSVAQMRGGDVVTVLDTRTQSDSLWYYVQTSNGREGWVSERIVRKESSGRQPSGRAVAAPGEPGDVPDLPDDLPADVPSAQPQSAPSPQKTTLSSPDEAEAALLDRLQQANRISPNETLSYLETRTTVNGESCWKFSAQALMMNMLSETGQYAISPSGKVYEFDDGKYVPVE